MDSNVGLRLKGLRLDFGFTQKQIADYLGFKQSQIAKLENDERKLKMSSLDKLCNLYGCPPEYILEGKGNYSKPNFAFRLDRNDFNLNTLADINMIIANLDRLSKLAGDVDGF